MLSNKQIKYLRGLANPLTPKYQVGKKEISDSTLELIDKGLTANELIKIQVLKTVCQDKEEIAQFLADKLDAELVQIIGNVIVLFRKNLKDGKIHLPC